ncbi:MAG: HAD-IIA family hydrolase [Rhodothermales bacterium]
MQRCAFKTLALDYKVIFFDAYGVLKNYRGMTPGIKATFDYLTERDIEFFVLTNDASRGPAELAEVYQRAGITQIDEQKVVSSGMLARDYLRFKVRTGVIAYLGTPASAHYIETMGLEAISIKDLDLNDADQINALVLLDDEGFDWNHDINKAVNLLRLRNIPVIVANTDASYPVARGQIAVSIGAVGDLLERVVRRTFIRFGKPEAQMFNFAFEHVQKYRQVTKNDILMVGDTLSTDIMGGNHFGIDTALVLTGNTLPHMADILIESTGIVPDFICDSAVI